MANLFMVPFSLYLPADTLMYSPSEDMLRKRHFSLVTDTVGKSNLVGLDVVVSGNVVIMECPVIPFNSEMKIIRVT